MKKYIVLALFLGLISVPIFASAQNVTIDQVLQFLRDNPSFLQTLIQLINQNNQSGNRSCHNFDINLKIGDGAMRTSEGVGTRGRLPIDDDVYALRNVLIRENVADFIQEEETAGSSMKDSDFNEDVATAVVKFQAKYGIRQTGYVGPITRGKLNQLYGCRKNNSNTPIINGVSGPTTLSVGQQGTWTVKVTDPQNGNLSYFVSWGDEPVGLVNSAGANPRTPAQQTATFTHAYANAGHYTISINVTNDTGRGANATLSVSVGNQTTSGITITSPNGGEQWVANSVQDIKWNPVYNCPPNYACDPSPSFLVDLYLDSEPPACVYSNPACLIAIHAPYVLDKNIDITPPRSGSSYGVYHWIVATDIINNLIPAGLYRVQVCLAGSTTNCDSSDQPFTITNAQTY